MLSLLACRPRVVLLDRLLWQGSRQIDAPPVATHASGDAAAAVPEAGQFLVTLIAENVFPSTQPLLPTPSFIQGRTNPSSVVVSK